MADNKKSILDAGKVDNLPEPGKVEPAKAAPPVQDHPASAKAEALVIEDASKVGNAPCGGAAGSGFPKARTLLLSLRRVRRSRVKTRSKPRSPAWEILPPPERWWILPLPGMRQQRAIPR